MSGKLEKTINSIHGCPLEESTTDVSFSSTTTSGLIGTEGDEDVFRVCATTDCYIGFYDPTSESCVATSAGVYVPANTPEYFSGTNTRTWIKAIRKTADGHLHVTKMKARGK
jgi:hypothetical protein